MDHIIFHSIVLATLCWSVTQIPNYIHWSSYVRREKGVNIWEGGWIFLQDTVSVNIQSLSNDHNNAISCLKDECSRTHLCNKRAAGNWWLENWPCLWAKQQTLNCSLGTMARAAHCVGHVCRLLPPSVCKCISLQRLSSVCVKAQSWKTILNSKMIKTHQTKIGGFKQEVLSSDLCLRSRCKYLCNYKL